MAMTVRSAMAVTISQRLITININCVAFVTPTLTRFVIVLVIVAPYPFQLRKQKIYN